MRRQFDAIQLIGSGLGTAKRLCPAPKWGWIGATLIILRHENMRTCGPNIRLILEKGHRDATHDERNTDDDPRDAISLLASVCDPIISRGEGRTSELLFASAGLKYAFIPICLHPTPLPRQPVHRLVKRLALTHLVLPGQLSWKEFVEASGCSTSRKLLTSLRDGTSWDQLVDLGTGAGPTLRQGEPCEIGLKRAACGLHAA